MTENLTLPPVIRSGGMDLNEVYDLFPVLLERGSSQGTKLSGGEQQMLAIARILRTGATLLLLDEPTEGLAPVIVEQIGRVIAALRERGFTILLVEQNFPFAARSLTATTWWSTAGSWIWLRAARWKRTERSCALISACNDNTKKTGRLWDEQPANGHSGRYRGLRLYGCGARADE